MKSSNTFYGCAFLATWSLVESETCDCRQLDVVTLDYSSLAMKAEIYEEILCFEKKLNFLISLRDYEFVNTVLKPVYTKSNFQTLRETERAN